MCVSHYDCSWGHLEVLLRIHSQLADSESEVALCGKSEDGCV